MRWLPIALLSFAVALPAVAEISHWKVEGQKDKITDKVVHFASVTPNDAVRLGERGRFRDPIEKGFVLGEGRFGTVLGSHGRSPFIPVLGASICASFVGK